MRSWISMYKIPLLTSITLAVVLIALDVTRAPISIAFIILGSLLGTFVLDLDYIIYAFFLEPDTDFSRTLTAFFKHSDIRGAFQYIQYHKDEITDLTLHSVVFQLAMIGVAIFGIYSAPSLFVKALILSVYVNAFYRLLMLFVANNYEKWFWALKTVPSKKAVSVYMIVLIGVFIFCLAIF